MSEQESRPPDDLRADLESAKEAIRLLLDITTPNDPRVDMDQWLRFAEICERLGLAV